MRFEIKIDNVKNSIGGETLLNIYTDISKIPEDYILINDNDIFAAFESITDTKYSREVIEIIEKGKYLDACYFTSRFGEMLPKMVMSTSSKTLINIYNNLKSKYVFNCSGLGENAIEFLMHYGMGNIYFRSRLYMDLPEDIDISNICVNGVEAKSIIELEDMIC